MSLASLTVSSFRNIQHAEIEFSPTMNIFVGENGSGKTSLLESIFYLSTTKSFRTSKVENLVNFDSEAFTLFARINDNDELTPLGIRRPAGTRQQNEIRLAGKTVDRVSKLVSVLPTQVVTPESYKLFFEGPSERRKFTDLGVFHVKQSFHQHWLIYSRLLKQRNALLRSKQQNYELYQVWDVQLSNEATHLDKLRSEYIDLLQTELDESLTYLLPDQKVVLSFARGWKQDEENSELGQLLFTNFERDLKQGYTQYGSHKFDLRMKVDGKPAELILSRGQLKLLLFALKVSQSKLIGSGKKGRSIFIVDDLPSELDEQSRDKLAKLFETCDFQFMISGIEDKNLHTFASKNFKMFHVKHGTLY